MLLRKQEIEVRNTFIDFAVARTFSRLDGSAESSCRVRSCPASLAGDIVEEVMTATHLWDDTDDEALVEDRFLESATQNWLCTGSDDIGMHWAPSSHPAEFGPVLRALRVTLSKKS